MLPWQQHSRSHSVSYVMFISGAKFREHCFNISRDIFDSVFYCSSGTICDLITFPQYKNINISTTKKEKAFQISSNKQQLFFTS